MHRSVAVSISVAAFSALLTAIPAFGQLSGEINAHDPSTIIKDGSTYYYYATGQNLVSRSSTDLVNWTAGPRVFASTPSWVPDAVPTGFDGNLWAPDIVRRNNQYYLYYSASAFGRQTSGIGLAISPTLNPSAPNYGFVDQGPVFKTVVGDPYNAIDPAILNDTNGRMWMTFGSYWNGIYATELNPSTGMRLNPNVAPTRIAGRSSSSDTSIEASALIQQGGYYYLFVNYFNCCSGIDSTYEIRVGRSTSPTGTFVDKNGVPMNNGGGSLFLDDDGAKIGPGHFNLLDDGTGQQKFNYHYYDGNRNGAPALGINNLYWTPDLWPTVGSVDVGWTGAATATWSNPSNWTGSIVPDGTGHIANFTGNGTNRRAITLSDGDRTLRRINFATSAAYDILATNGHALNLVPMAADAAATINVSFGSHSIRAPLRVTGDLGVNVILPASTLSLAGQTSAGSLHKYGDGSVTLANTHAYTGGIYVRNGTVNIDGVVGTSQFVAVGQGVGDVATMTVRNVGTLNAAGDLNIGDNGAVGSGASPATGTLNIRDLGIVNIAATGGFYVGSGFVTGANAVGTVNQTGGTLTANGNFDGAFVVGGRNSARGTGVYNLSGGTINANTNVFIGGRGNGTVNQTGGTFNATKFVSVARFAGSTGTWNVGNAIVNQADSTGSFIVGEGGSGRLDINSGGDVSTNGGIRLGSLSNSSGTINLNAGGRLTTASVTRGLGTATLNLNGGTVRASAANTNFVQLAAGEVEVLAGGVTIDTNGHAVTLARPLDGPGALTKTGAGTLTLGVVHNFRGGVNVNAGTMSVRQLTNNGGLSITGGAVQLLAPSTPFDQAQRSTVNSLAITNGASLDLGQNLFVIDHAAGTSPLGFVAAAIVDGRITSANLAARQAIGFADASSLATIPTAFGTVDSSALLMRLTLLGDAGLDGTVNFADLVTLAQNYNATGRSWVNGDFNGDAAVNFADLVSLAQNYNTSITPAQAATLDSAAGASFASDFALAQSIVPEPTTLAALAVVGLTVVRRRR